MQDNTISAGAARRHLGLAVSIAVVAVTLLLAVTARPADAAFDVTAFDGQLTANPAGDAYTQAGGHPYQATTWIDLSTAGIGDSGFPVPDGNAKNVQISLPPGLVGDPGVGPKCQEGLLESGACPANTQIGFMTVHLPAAGFGIVGAGIFNVVPRDGVIADFGADILGQGIVHLIPQLRTDGSFGLDIDSRDTTQTLPLTGIQADLWGVPADPSHDALRLQPATGGCIYLSVLGQMLCAGGNQPSDQPLKPFLTNPTDCSAGPLATTVRADSWQHPGQYVTKSFTSHLPPAYPADPSTWGAPTGVTGCDQLEFKPALSATPETTKPDTPTGLAVDLSFPDGGLRRLHGTTEAQLRKATVALPEGMTINPSAANGLAACSDAQLGLTSDAPAACPDAAKVGTVEATSPLLAQYDIDGHVNLDGDGVPIPEKLTGGIYLRSQASNDPASGDMFRIALVLESKKRGVLVKLGGSISADPSTGRLTTTFDNNPQVPVSDIKLQFKSGPRAPLVTPASCGEQTIQAHLTAWSGQTADLRTSFTMDCSRGAGGFAPTLTSGVMQPVGGASSPFALTIIKPDADTALTGIRLDLPGGLLAQVKGNVGSQVGTVTAFAGPGSNPYALPGAVYLDGPYGDAPYSLRVEVPAKAGPFDLGLVTVKQKIYVDPHDAHVTIVSDPLPTVVGGVPVRLQRLDVTVDKPGFMINPTSCEAKTINATLGSAAGQTVPIANHFRVGDCAALGYAPDLAMTLSGKGQAKDGAHPRLDAHLTTSKGDANAKQVTVSLPLSLALDPGNANGLCEPADAAANRCPAESIVGHASARSILPDPLTAPVYFVRGERKDPKSGRTIKTLPDLFIPLTADGVTVDITAASDVVDDRLVTRFTTLPDAPFDAFDLTIDGGPHGILAVSGTNICTGTQIADGELTGQNGKVFTPAITMATTQCKLGIAGTSHTATALKVTVGGLGAGKVTVTGKGLTRTSRTIGKATAATLTVPMSKAMRRSLSHHRNVKVKVKVAFTPKGTKKPRRVSKTITIHAAKAKRG